MTKQVSFEKLGLKKDIITALTKQGITSPLEVQEKIIPLVLQKQHVVFTSPTGSGKTLAYTLGFLGRINPKQGLQLIIITPTRELCIQVGKELKKICTPLSLNVGTLYGGRDIQGDYKTTNKKNQILVATPGRFIDHINAKVLAIGNVRNLIYDESDQMFDQGFYDDCLYIKERVSKDAQIVLSSATISIRVKEFIQEHVFPHELIHVGSYIPKNITQEKIYCTIAEKPEILLQYLTTKKHEQTIIFVNTKVRCEELKNLLEQEGIKARIMSGDLTQIERNNNLNLFKDKKCQVLVTTDVAARGLHIENIELVINYDIPTREEFYVHRIGRTGRKTKTGTAMSLVCPEDEERFKNIEEKYELKVTTLQNK